MSTDFDGTLTYRDYVVHIFTGILFDVFLFVSLWPILPSELLEYDLQNELIWSLIAIPVLFLEGHFILAVNRFFMVEVFNWLFVLYAKCLCRKRRKRRNQTNNTCSCHHSKMYYRTLAIKLQQRWYDNLFDNCSILFFLLISARISGQKIVRKKKDGIIVETAKNELSIRYYSLSDFFKGVSCAAFIAMVVAIGIFNWWGALAMFIILILSRQRSRYFSMLHVKNGYEKIKIPCSI